MSPRDLTLLALFNAVREATKQGALEDARILLDVINNLMVDPGSVFDGINRRD